MYELKFSNGYDVIIPSADKEHYHNCLIFFNFRFGKDIMIEENEYIKMKDEHTVEINLPSELGYERVAMECSASFAKMAGFIPEKIEDLKTAVSEACLNAMEHGNKGQPDTRVVISMNFRDHAFNVTVTDQGNGIPDPENVVLPDIKKKIENLQTPRGMGLFLIEQLMDHVEFNKMTKEGHMVKMVLNLTGQKEVT